MSRIEEEQEAVTVEKQDMIVEEQKENADQHQIDMEAREESTVAKEKRQPVKKEKESPKAHTIRFVIILALAAVVVLGIYLHLTNQSKNSAQQAEENMTEMEALKNYDLTNQYPKQVRDIVKLHCRYLKSMYNEDVSEEDLDILNTQVRMLYSEILLAENEKTAQYAELLNDVANFHGAGKLFIGYTVDVEENVKYSTVDDIEYAVVNVTTNIKEGSTTNALQSEYLLVKENEQWKILGWQAVTAE